MPASDEWPHYRDPNLTDDVAQAAITAAANHATEATLKARRDLLAAGINESHPMCQVLDSFASCMTYVVTDHLIADPRRVIGVGS